MQKERYGMSWEQTSLEDLEELKQYDFILEVMLNGCPDNPAFEYKEPNIYKDIYKEEGIDRSVTNPYYLAAPKSNCCSINYIIEKIQSL